MQRSKDRGCASRLLRFRFRFYEMLDGFNPLHTHIDKGFRIHPSLVITEEGTPLGVLSTTNHTRDKEEKNPSKKHRNSLSIEEKESFRWLLGYREACKLAEKLPHVEVISISDREGDIYEVCLEAKIEDKQCKKADILVRSNHNRCLKDATDKTEDKLEKKLIRCPVKSEGKIILNRYRSDEHTADVVIRSCEVLIQAPQTCQKKSLPPIKMNAVLVSEVDPPKGIEPQNSG